MKTLRTFRWVLSVALVFTYCRFAAAHSESEEAAAEHMAEAANRFLAALSPEQRQKAVYEMKADERFNWHFIPKTRNGLPMNAMTSEQQPLALALLNSGLSHQGYFKATTIMSLEQILHELEQGKGPKRDPELYFVTIFGAPGPKNTWGWRFEGHHLALNFTIVEGHHIAATPSFLGSNPAEVRVGPRKGLRTLAAEEDLARELAKSLNEEQKRVAIYSNEAPKDIITGADRKARLLKPDGLPAIRLNDAQAKLLWAIIREYVFRARPAVAEVDLRKIEKAGKEKIFFAWAGSLEKGQGHYYRVQGPTFLLEYDNTQNNANHVHAVWRDLENDFGEDLLREHYRKDHK